MQFEGYRQVQFIAGAFNGLLGKTLSPVDKDDEDSNWYVEIMIGGRPVVREVPASDIKYTR